MIERTYIGKADAFHQAVAVEANGVKTIHVSGQVGSKGSLGEQSKEAFAGVKAQLAAAGAVPADVVKLTTYIVDYSIDKLDAAFAGFGEVFGDPETLPAHTLIGVQALYLPHVLIEVEATAVVEAG